LTDKTAVRNLGIGGSIFPRGTSSHSDRHAGSFLWHLQIIRDEKPSGPVLQFLCKRFSLYKPLYREKTVYIKTHKTAINRPVDHTVVPLLVNSFSKTRSISWQILVFLSLRLVISVKKMQGVYEQGNVWSKTWKINQAAFLKLYGLDFTYCCNEKISFRLRVLLIWTVIYLFVAASFSVGNRLGTVCTQRWKTCAGLAPRRWKDCSSIAVFIRPWMSIALNL